MTIEQSVLFSPYTLGPLNLANRVVMAPMTRSRAIGNVPNDLMTQYYADRAGAGLIITEGVAPSANGLGYSRIPGCFTDEQAAGWKNIADAVHAKSGKIFMQIMHTGRVAHPYNMPAGAKVVAPSPIAADGTMWTDTHQMQAHPVPEEIPTAEIPNVIAEYVHSAKLAVAAGLDGIEIHAANGYLPMQFLSPSSNQRTDQYGGSPENRNRFVLELAAALVAAIGTDRVGIRLSPFNPYNGLTPDATEEAQYLALTEGLSSLGLVYLHLVTYAMPKAMIPKMRKAFNGTLILNAGYTADRASSDIEANACDLVSFGNPFISNPDLVHRMRSGIELTPADPSTFFTPGAEGYNTYPAHM